jgi:hypothetical protein
MIGRTVQRVNQLSRAYLAPEIVLQVIGLDGAQHWISASPTMVKHDFQARVMLESMLPPDRNRQSKEIMEIMNIMAKVNPEGVLPLMRTLLSKFPWADVNSMLPQAPQDGTISGEEFIAQESARLGSKDLGKEAAGNMQLLLENGTPSDA